MHIVHCLTHSMLGGGQQAVFHLVQSLLRNYPQVKITVLLPPDGIYVDRFRSLGVQVAEFPFDRISLLNIFTIRPLLKKLRSDIVHSHGKGAGLYVRLLPAFFFRPKFFHSYHGFHLPNNFLKSFLYIFLERFLLKKTDTVIAVSHSEAVQLQSRFPASSRTIKTISNVVDCRELRNAGNKLEDNVDSFLGQHASLFIVAMVARHDPVKNYPLALEAARIVLGKRNDFAFIFVGVNVADHQFHLLKEQYPERVMGVESTDALAEIYKRCSVLLLTSKKEGSPLVIQEGFCFGKPAVATDVAGNRDLLSHRVNGLLCEESPSAISNALILLKQDNQLYNDLCDHALKFAAGRESGTWAKLYYELYSELRG